MFTEHLPCARRHPNALEGAGDRGSAPSPTAPAPLSAVPHSLTPNGLSFPYARPAVSPVLLPLRDILPVCHDPVLPFHATPPTPTSCPGPRFLRERFPHLQISRMPAGLFWNLTSVVNVSSLCDALLNT